MKPVGVWLSSAGLVGSSVPFTAGVVGGDTVVSAFSFPTVNESFGYLFLFRNVSHTLGNASKWFLKMDAELYKFTI